MPSLPRIRLNGSPRSTPMPEMISLSALQRAGTDRLRAAGADNPALDARLLLCHAAGVSHETLVAHSDTPATEDARAEFEMTLARRAAGEPVARILGEKEFWGLTFKLGPDTLVPRPDSECIVAAALEAVANPAAPLRVLDLGTGTGCLLLALLTELPNANGVGIDISEGALRTARTNAMALGLAARASFARGNWAESVQGPFDIIVSNPPYIPSDEIGALTREVRDHDPSRALDGGTDGLDCYRVILNQAQVLFAPKGQMVLETSPDLVDALTEMIHAMPYRADPARISDLAGRVRGLRFAKDDFAR